MEMAFNQKEEKCILGGLCPFLLHYQGVRWCISEILGYSCSKERVELLSRQEAQKVKRRGFPFRLPRVMVFPSKPLRKKGGASFFS